MNFLALKLQDQKIGYKQLAQLIIEAIEGGTLASQSLLPPSRILADQLGVSRDTVYRCYKHLQHLAYIEARGTKGMFVRGGSLSKATRQSLEKEAAAAALVQARRLQSRLSNYGVGMLENTEPHSIAPDFPAIQFGAVPANCLPVRRWRELLQAQAQTASVRNLKYDMEVLGRIELREALAAYVGRSKGITCAAADIAVFNISFSAYSLICRLILNAGDTIAIEEPGFGGIKNVAGYLGLDVFSVPLDEEGLSVKALEQSGKKIKLVYVTPDHQEPTGITMTPGRRRQLLDWAETNDAWLLEDDYDGFFHYGKQPPPNLKLQDQNQRVIYFGTFWQLLYPLATVCFLVLPESFVPILTKSKIQTEGITETMLQLALAEMLQSGFLQKHARKIERGFALKRSSVIHQLKRVFGPRIQINKQNGGLTCFVEFNGWSDGQITKAAKQAGFALLPATYYYSGRGGAGQYVIYFPGFAEGEIKGLVEAFRAALRDDD